MGSPSPSEKTADVGSDGLVIEWIGDKSATSSHSSDAPREARYRRRSQVVAVALLIIAAALVAVSFATVGNDPQPALNDQDSAALPAPRVVRPVSPLPELVEEAPLVDQLPSTDPHIVDGQVLAWIDLAGQLQLRSLSSGDDLAVGVLAAATLPPLPSHVHLLGAPNSTWLLNLEDSSRSGKLSNSVRMVRFGSSLDSYGFSSSSDGRTEFFLGSLWGPAMNGLAEVDVGYEVFYVPNAGIIVSGQDGTSASLVGSGLEPLPSRLGRVVAATSERVAGIHCDDLGRCIGRIADWDGGNEVQVEAATLAEPVVRFSPDGDHIVSGGGSDWNLIDVVVGTHKSWRPGFRLNDSVVWSTDSETVFFADSGALLAVSVLDNAPSVTRVRSMGTIDERLMDSDVALFEEFNGP